MEKLESLLFDFTDKRDLYINGKAYPHVKNLVINASVNELADLKTPYVKVEVTYEENKILETKIFCLENFIRIEGVSVFAEVKNKEC